MKVSELKSFIDFNREQIAQSILNGSYRPKAIKDERKIPTKEDECQGDIQMSEPRSGWVWPKSNGRVPLLGIPTVVDRWLQQAVGQQ